MRALVAGGGIIGGSIAWRLAQAGLPVTLHEAGTFGCEASSAGAGMLAPGGEFERPSVWAALGVESLALYPSFVSELEAESGLSIDFRICGALEITSTPAERARRQAAFGVRAEITADGLFYPDDGYVDSTDVVRALRRALEHSSVELRERHAAREIAAEHYGAVILAAGAWSSNITISWRGCRLELPEVHPVKGHLLGYRMAPGSLGSIRRHGRTYILQRASGFTIAGSTEESVSFDRGVDDAICRELHERAVRLWPALADAHPSERWIGFRPATLSGAPHVGRVADTNVWLAYGHYRNGILLAPITAQRVANEVISSWGTD